MIIKSHPIKDNPDEASKEKSKPIPSSKPSTLNNNQQPSALSYHQKLNVDIASGLIAGVLGSGIFNPWDRALYLSVKYNRSFLSAENFKSPYQGFSQAMVQRAFLGGIYFTLQGELNAYVLPYLRNELKASEHLSQFVVGMMTGSLSGSLTNSISATKYHTWGQENASFLSSVKEMWNLGGIRPFLKGTIPTMARDMAFGSTYEWMRSLKNNDKQTVDKQASSTNHAYSEFTYNATAAGIATIVSSPLNYVRNMVYATPPGLKPPTIHQAFSHLCEESKKQTSYLSQLSFFQNQLRIGWGTARVAAGMAVGQKLVDMTRTQLTERYSV